MRVHLPSLIARGCLGILALCFFQGCDDVRAALDLDPEVLEQQLRAEPGRPGKVGQVIALGVRQRAMRASEAFAFQPEPLCVTSPEDALAPSLYFYTLELDLSSPNASRPPLSWREEVSIARDASGNVRVVQKTSYSQETGHQGDREHVWLSVGDRVYASSDGERFVEHRALSERASRAWVARRANTLQVLLSAVGGWERAPNEDGASASWRAGADVLRCGALVSEDELKWWSRWRSRGSVRDASLVVGSDRSRELTASWELGQEARLEARFTDRFEEGGSKALEAPPSEARVARTETWAEVDRALESLEGMKVISSVVEGDEGGADEPARDGAEDD